jgi:hypothetical protein
MATVQTSPAASRGLVVHRAPTIWPLR